MNRVALGFAVVLVAGRVLAGDPPESGLQNPGKADQFSRNFFEQQQGRPEGSVNPTREGVPAQQLAAGTYTPPPGRAERGTNMDGIRGPIVAELRQAVLFKVEFLRVRDGWTFLKAQPRRPDGGPIDYKKTKFRETVA